jgi:hypothetical protein
METKVPTSFIPKKPINSESSGHTGAGIFSLLAFIIFLCALVLSGGVFVYRIAVQKNIELLKANLKKSEQTFDTDFINTVVRLNTRIETAKLLLHKHIAITPVFDLLEQNTLSTVTFRDFHLTPGTNDKFTVIMKGVAKDYNSIALQSDVFGKSKYLRDVIFADLNPDTSGNIGFTFKATIDGKLVSFEDVFNSTQSQQQPQAQQQVQPKPQQQPVQQTAAQTQAQPQQSAPATSQQQESSEIDGEIIDQ